jgi:hypothetical protein
MAMNGVLSALRERSRAIRTYSAMSCLLFGCSAVKPGPHHHVHVVANDVASEQQPSREPVEPPVGDVNTPEMKVYRLQNFLPGQATEAQESIGGFPVLEEATVADPSLRNEVIAVFGNKENFNDKESDCFYPELAFSFPPTLAEGLVDTQRPPPDGASLTILVSLACNRVKALGFTWPHAGSGLDDETAARLAVIVKGLFQNL